MKNKTIIYGLFFTFDDTKDLLGLYSSKEEAEKARDNHLAEEFESEGEELEDFVILPLYVNEPVNHSYLYHL